MNVEDEKGLTRITIEALEQLRIPYMVTGSVASFIYGEPRVTYDIDIVINPSSEAFHALLDVLEPHAYVSREAAMDAFRRRQMFNAIGFETAEKVALILLRDRPYSTAAFDRRRRMALKTMSFMVSTPEDSVLSKLSWARRGGSERQLRDVYGILRNKLAELDWDYLERWAAELAVSSSLAELRAQAEQDNKRE